MSHLNRHPPGVPCSSSCTSDTGDCCFSSAIQNLESQGLYRVVDELACESAGALFYVRCGDMMVLPVESTARRLVNLQGATRRAEHVPSYTALMAKVRL